MACCSIRQTSRMNARRNPCRVVERTRLGEEGFARARDQCTTLFDAAGYGATASAIDPSVVRGLEYYTGPVFECELLMETKDEDGQHRALRFGRRRRAL